MTKLPAPVEGPTLHKLTDKGIAHYVDFPDDVIFMESAAVNVAYQPKIAYIPVQRWIGNKPQSFLYKVDAANLQDGATFAVEGPLQSPDGSTDITIFGSALSPTGILYLCCFNRNSLLVYNLKTSTSAKAWYEIPNLASPNDMCIDPQDEHQLYVAGGAFRRLCGACCTFSNSARGQVYSIKVGSSKTKKKNGIPPITTDVLARGLDVLAGIEVIGKEIWVAQLYDVFVIDKATLKKKTVWSGKDGKGQVWLADNIDVFVDNSSSKKKKPLVLYPAYSTLPEGQAKALRRNCLVSLVSLYTQVATACMRGESLRQALLDPEVALEFSNTYVKKGEAPQPLRLVLQDPTGDRIAHHFEVSLDETLTKHPKPRTIKDPKTGKVLGKRNYFNEQVTHASQIGKYILCINFEQPRILFLDDKPFRSAMKSNAAVY